MGFHWYIPATAEYGVGAKYTPWQVLTRQDQLRLKEQKKQQRDQEKEDKKAEKAKAKEEAQAAKARAKEEAQAAKAKAKEAKNEAKAKAGAKAKAKGKAKAKAAAKTQSEATAKAEKKSEEAVGPDSEQAPEAEEEAEKNKKRRLRKLETKETAGLEVLEKVEDHGAEAGKGVEEPAPKKPRRSASSKAEAAPKAKAKVKSAPKRKSKASKGNNEDDPCEEETGGEKTPRKALFQSDEEGSHDDEEGSHDELRLDPKTGKALPLKEHLEKCAPEAHLKQRPSKRDADQDPAQEAGSSQKNKSKGAKFAKVNLSPFAKKQARSRKKTEQTAMHQEPTEDKVIQGLCLQHMKNVEGLEYEEVKAHLKKHLANDQNEQFVLNPYWGRSACGVKVVSLSESGLKKNAPEVAYFTRYGTSPKGWNFSMALVYVSASLMDLRLHLGGGDKEVEVMFVVAGFFH